MHEVNVVKVEEEGFLRGVRKEGYKGCKVSKESSRGQSREK